VNKRSGTVDLSDERNAISDVVFCQEAYAQVDFVEGDVINDDGTVTVNYDPDDYDDSVPLAVYRVSDPVFQDNDFTSFGDTRCRQTLVDSDHLSRSGSDPRCRGVPAESSALGRTCRGRFRRRHDYRPGWM